MINWETLYHYIGCARGCMCAIEMGSTGRKRHYITLSLKSKLCWWTGNNSSQIGTGILSRTFFTCCWTLNWVAILGHSAFRLPLSLHISPIVWFSPCQSSLPGHMFSGVFKDHVLWSYRGLTTAGCVPVAGATIRPPCGRGYHVDICQHVRSQ